MDKKFKAKIIQALRKLSWSWPPRKIAMKKQQLDSQLFECEICKSIIYTGTSDKNYQSYVCRRKNVKRGKIALDHVKSVIAPESGFVDWNTYIERLFCPEDNYQVICEDCHLVKTNEEKALAAKHRKLQDMDEY